MRAVELGTSIGGLNLDEACFEPIWARLEEAGFLVFLHPPRVTAAAPRLGRYFLNNLIGNPLEGVLAATALVFGGVLDRHPDLHVCLPHAGGYFPYQVGRLDRGFVAKDECREHLRRPPGDYLGRFWYDTLTFRSDTLRFLAAPFAASLILTVIHSYLGVHVVERGVIFVDLSLAQIAALGASIAILLPFTGGDPHGLGPGENIGV